MGKGQLWLGPILLPSLFRPLLSGAGGPRGHRHSLLCGRAAGSAASLVHQPLPEAALRHLAADEGRCPALPGDTRWGQEGVAQASMAEWGACGAHHKEVAVVGQKLMLVMRRQCPWWSDALGTCHEKVTAMGGAHVVEEFLVPTTGKCPWWEGAHDGHMPVIPAVQRHLCCPWCSSILVVPMMEWCPQRVEACGAHHRDVTTIAWENLWCPQWEGPMIGRCSP